MPVETVLLYTLVPVLALILAAMIAVHLIPRNSVVSLFQHFAAGVVFAAVAVELLPVLKKTGDPLIMAAGFIIGVITMLLIGKFAEKLGMVIPIAVDLFVDGMLVAIGFATGSEGGFILLIGLSMEAVSLGLSEAPSLIRKGFSKEKVIWLTIVLGVSLLCGSAFGNIVVGISGHLIVGILGFGVAALLYLVTEELLVEAHEVEDTPFITAMFSSVSFYRSFWAVSADRRSCSINSSGLRTFA